MPSWTPRASGNTDLMTSRDKPDGCFPCLPAGDSRPRRSRRPAERAADAATQVRRPRPHNSIRQSICPGRRAGYTKWTGP
ncbi:hypothetical protein GCM10022214_11350 [Actinomadura miaoliensis]|uniref:Uncharacterized protein n=1 Tax=Actinomadura miaoliensis TaxID=430685 RepID=A0ABP7V642_9ACTN